MKPRYIHLQASTLKKLKVFMAGAQRDRTNRVVKRIQAILLNHEGSRSTQIADTLKVSRSKVSKWLKNYELYGIESLWEGHRSGRPAQLSKAQETRLTTLIEINLKGKWSVPKIRQFINHEFGIRYTRRHIYYLLAKLGFSARKESVSDGRKRWIRYLYPNLKQKPLRKSSF